MEKLSIYNYEAYLLDYSEAKLSPSEIKELLAFLALHPELDSDLNDLSLPTLIDNPVQADFKDNLKRTSLYISEEELLDYIEGNLSASKKSEVEHALASDKTLAKEFKLFQYTLLSADKSVMYADKALLLKNEDELLLNNKVLAYLENDLSTNEKIEFEENLKLNSHLNKNFNLFKKTILFADTEIVYENKEELKKRTKVVYLFTTRVWAPLAAAVLLIVGSMVVFTNFFKNEAPLQHLSFQKKQEPNPIHKSLTNTIQRPAVSNSGKVSENKNSVQALSATPSKVNPFIASVKQELNAYSKQEQKSDSSSYALNDPTKNYGANSIEKKVTNLDLSIENKQEISKAIESELTKLSSLQEVEDEEETNLDEAGVRKNGFWKNAVKLANRVNSLGLKSVRGTASNNDQYLLSFNSFSIEKK